MSHPISELMAWDEKIRVFVDAFRLKVYPQEFEVCDYNEMLGYMAYSGMPSRYSHWSFGQSFERQKTMYDYGVSGLPYEMVINSNPCLAYLMRDNTLLLQILTISHVYGHNDFFANNFTFTSAFDAAYTLEMFRNHGDRIDRYMSDPSIGLEQVEATLDHAHALMFQCSRNLAVKKLSHEEQRQRAWQRAQLPEDPHRAIHPAQHFTPPNLDRFPLEPDPDILSFIAEYNPYLPEWQRDVLQMVEKESRYFIPQIETKIMNEGWASYWHHRIMNALKLPHDLHLEFLVRHSQVLRPTPGGLNPYHLGFLIWHDIERRENERAGIGSSDEDREALGGIEAENATPGRQKIFQIRESDRDTSFLRRFLTVDIMRELELFQHEKKGKDRIVTKVADDENWEEIKESLLHNVGMSSIPVIKIADGDFGKKRTLYLVHEHDGRDLLMESAEPVLRHIQALWGREVVLETSVNGKRTLLKTEGEEVTAEKM